MVVVFVALISLLHIISMKSQVSEYHNFTFAHISNEIATFTGARSEVGGLEEIQARGIRGQTNPQTKNSGSERFWEPRRTENHKYINWKFITIDIKRFRNLYRA